MLTSADYSIVEVSSWATYIQIGLRVLLIGLIVLLFNNSTNSIDSDNDTNKSRELLKWRKNRALLSPTRYTVPCVRRPQAFDKMRPVDQFNSKLLAS